MKIFATIILFLLGSLWVVSLVSLGVTSGLKAFYREMKGAKDDGKPKA
jgi:hypothetical protein